MKVLRTILLLVVSFLFSVETNAGHLSSQLMFTAQLDAAQEVTSSTSTARGVATVLLSGTGDSLFLNATFNGLTSPIGAIAGVGLYMGKKGQESPTPLLPLNTFMIGSTISARIGGSIASKEIIAAFLRGEVYINVKTINNPTGEIRGQFELETDYGFHAMLDGAQVTPPVTTNATGLAIFKLSKDHSMLVVHGVVNGLSGAMASASLSNQAMSSEISLLFSGNIIRDTITRTNFGGDSALFAGFVNEIMTGGIYINATTAQNANGEIRGKLLMGDHLKFDAVLTGDQETPEVPTNAFGVANFMISANLDTLDYQVMTDGLSGPITMAHIHLGGVDTAGPVIIPLTVTANNMISGRLLFTSLTPDARDSILALLLQGRTYVNVHTELYPAGEVRGQVYRLAREGFSFIVSGMQENPPVVTTAMGSGMVSYDRDQTNLHYMVVVNNLLSPVVGAHFHKGRPGENGPVMFGLKADSTNFGYWTGAGTPQPFNSTVAAMMRKDSVYFNIHTELYQSGEARGQVTRTPQQIILSMNDGPLIAESNLTLYPNPVTETAVLAISSDQHFTGRISISDVRGATLYSANLTISQGEAAIPLSFANFASGTYIIRAEANGKLLFMQKVTKP